MVEVTFQIFNQVYIRDISRKPTNDFTTAHDDAYD